MVALAIFGSFILLLILSMPVGYAIGISAVAGFLTAGMPVDILPSYCLSGTNSFYTVGSAAVCVLRKFDE